ncbi:ABC transporter substrate-binding protein [Fluviicola taffensis]|uniref:ABC transporter substrate-binding protein n=1 Tax=Fluviicola taffensis (strain DSM 16823 / NCIMB 13979 / RW262) TaxID=755732 RepID=F2IB12_FLUTR|nr:ABC transporter substrate-binding protein [Fluviicola taffensis]AEA42095.1 ABC transporter substrate-binding protein [Fluviicola taffensis DSM 16823]
MQQTIGLLLPRSTYYRGLSFDLFEGVRSSLKQLEAENIRIVTENIGFGTDKQMCYKAAEQLIMHENATVVLAYIGHRMAQVLRPLFQAANRLLIVLDSGANAPHEWPETPNIIYHSLHNTFGSWLTAKRAVNDGFSQGGMVTGYYDGGYLQTWGISSGFTTAGGNISFNHATGYNKDDFSMLPLKEHAEKNPNGALLSLFSGDYVHWYFDGLKEVFGENHLPIYLPPFGCEETMLKDAKHPGGLIKGIAAWSYQLDNPANKLFIECIESSGRTANLFSLLGWEGAIIGVHATNLMLEQKNNVQFVADALNDFSFEGPRGKVYFHAPTRHTMAPMYKTSIQNNGNDGCSIIIEKKIDETVSDFEEFIALPMENAISGWYNSYTCI